MFQENKLINSLEEISHSCFIKTITFNVNRTFKYLKIKEIIFYFVKLGLSYGCSEYVLCLVAQPCLFVTTWTGSPGSSVHGNSPGRNTGVGCHALLRGIFSTQWSNPDLLHYKQIHYHLSHRGSLWILERVTYPFFKGSTQPRNQTSISYIAGGLFTSWTIREAYSENSFV